MSIFKKKEIKIDFHKLPHHIAFIIDGNGRWAKLRNMPRTFGHKIGVNAVQNTVFSCYELGINQVSFYCFSTENWNRPKQEIDAIFNLIRDYLKNDLNEYVEKGIKFYVSGDLTKLPTDLQNQIEHVIYKTRDCDKMKVNICLNYGGRAEIVRAVNEIIKQNVEAIDENSFKNYLYTKDFEDPDLIIRTSGEKRISNFMLYQLAYSEFYFTKTFWPDFNKKELLLAIKDFQSRNRRFGHIKE